MRQFNTLTGFLLSKSSNPTTDDTVEFQGYSAIGDGGAATWQHNGVTGQTPSQSPLNNNGKLTDGSGNEWKVVSGNIVSLLAFGGLTVAHATAALESCLPRGIKIDFSVADISVSIPVPSLALTLQEAVDYSYLCNISQGNIFDVIIDTAHEPLSGVNVSSGNYSAIRISSIDAVVTLGAGFSSVADFMVGNAATTPVLNALIDAQGRCRYGANIQENSEISVNTGCGVINTSQRGIYLNGTSKGNVSGSLWTGCGSIISTGLNRAAWVARGSTLIAESADFSFSEGIGVYLSRASTCHAMDVKINSCGEQALWCHRTSSFTGHGSTSGTELSTNGASTLAVIQVDRASTVAINADSGGVTITQRGSGDGATVANSIADFDLARFVQTNGNSETALKIAGSATVTANAAFIDGYNRGIENNSATLSAIGVNVIGSRAEGVNTKRGRTVITNAEITNNTGLDITNEEGAFTNADGCTTTNSVGTPALADTNVPAFSSLSNRGAIFI